MATCDNCLYFTVCEALEQGNGIKKVHPIQCGCFKDKANFVEVVRCWECRHCDPESKHCDHFMGTTLPYPRKETDFCSYGELKEHEGK